MANLIDSTYFINDINLPPNALSGAREDISQYIPKYEKQALILLLGYELYKDFIANPGATRWTRLKNGHEYDVSYKGLTTTIKWNGLTNTDLVSLLSYYIYFYYYKFHATQTTTIGESVTAKENAQGVQPVRKMVNAWNGFVDLYGKVIDSVINPTAYNFLYNFKDDAVNGYDGWIFTPIERMNILSI